MARRHLWAILLALACVAAQAQFVDNQERKLDCRDQGHSDRATFCEMREYTLPGAGTLNVDGQMNGGVSVKGWSRNDVLVRAQVRTQADTDAEAHGLAQQVRVTAAAGQVRADGPDTQGHRNWSVSYEVFVPHRTDLSLKAHNGGIAIADVGGRLEFETMNGGLALKRLAGTVNGRTMNGGVAMELTGSRWDGDGVDVTTMNGGVSLTVPDNYSARLETGTVNGGMHLDFPVTVSGEVKRQLSTTLGSGGALIRVKTTNGGVSVKRRTI